MRVRYGLVAGSLVLAGAFASAWSQAPKHIDPGQITTVAPPAPPAVSDIRVRPTGDGRLSTPVTTVKELNQEECEALGGTVKDDVFRVCKSGKVCWRTDNFGNVRGVCLTAKAE